MEDNILTITGANGMKYNIKVIDIFSVDEFSDKEYIAYSFEKEIENKAYISILNEYEENFSLVGISNKDEWEIVEKAFTDSIRQSINSNNDI